LADLTKNIINSKSKVRIEVFLFPSICLPYGKSFSLILMNFSDYNKSKISNIKLLNRRANQKANTTLQKLLQPLLTIKRDYLLTTLALVLIISWVSFNGRQGPSIELYDYWEHSASIKEMSRNLLAPGNPFLQLGGSTTLRYSPYIFFLALLKKITGFNLSFIIAVTSILNFLLLTIGIYLFCKEYFQDEEQPLYTLITLLFLWGGAFGFSSEYNLRFLSYTLFYPSEVTFSLSFIGFFYLLRFARGNKLSDYLKYLFLAIFIFSSHPLTGSFFLLGTFFLTITEGQSWVKNSVFYFLSLIIVFLFLILWPYYPFLKAVYNSLFTPWAEETRMYLYATKNVYKMGPALLGIPAVLLLLIKRKYYFISFGFIACASVYLLTYKPKIYLGERYIFYMIFFLHLALSWYLKTLGLLSFKVMKETLRNLNEKNLHVLILALILLFSISYQIAKLGFEQMGYTIDFKPKPVIQKYINPTDKYRVLIGKLREGDVVVSDPLTSWLIPTLTGSKIVALYHDNPLGSDNATRVEDSITLYRATTPLETRKVILDKYNVSHVLLNLNRMEDNKVNRVNDYYKNFSISDTLINDFKKIGEIIFKNNDFILFKSNFI